jgi:hypothetical protein
MISNQPVYTSKSAQSNQDFVGLLSLNWRWAPFLVAAESWHTFKRVGESLDGLNISTFVFYIELISLLSM